MSLYTADLKAQLRASQAVSAALQRDVADKEKLLAEALEAMLNLAPRIKNDRGGCFGDGGKECACTACKIRRELRALRVASGKRKQPIVLRGAVRAKRRGA